MSFYDKDEIIDAYEDVRSDATETNWALFTYDENKQIKKEKVGEDYDELVEFVNNHDDRVYCYIRVQTGDELSKRAKFALVLYIADGVSALKKAKCSTDKATLKDICRNFAAEFLVEGEKFNMDEVIEDVRKAGGANYGSAT